MKNEPKNENKNEKEWKLATNAQYQDAMKIVVNLATASLVLPTLLINYFLPPGAPIKDHLNSWAGRSWVLLFLSILIFMLFIYASAKYVKVVSGGKEKPAWPLRFFYDCFHKSNVPRTPEEERVYPEDVIETTRDAAIVLSIVCFMVGLVCLGFFFLTLK